MKPDRISTFSSSTAKEIAPVAPGAWPVAVGIVVLLVVLYSQSWRDLWPRWMDTQLQETTYTHGIMIVLVSAWLIWRARARLIEVPVKPLPWVTPLVLVLSLAWLVAARANILTVHSALWPLLAWVTILASCGRRVAMALAFPLAYLWFAVPIWGYFNGAFQSMTVLGNSLLLKVSHVPAVIVGNLVLLPHGRFEIEGGCSGLHFFIVALAVSTLAGELHKDRLPTRVFLIALAIALAVLSNWVRVYTIILAGYLTDMKHYLVTVDHYKFGWLVFGLAMVVFFLVMRRLPIRAVTAPNQVDESVRAEWRRGLLAGIVAVILLPATSWVAIALHGKPVGDVRHFARPVQGFSGPLSPSPSWQPNFAGATSDSRASFVSPSGRVLDYYGNSYVEQSQGRELIGYDNTLLDPERFDTLRLARVARDPDRQQPPMLIMETRHESGQSWIVVYYYDVAGTPTADKFIAQLLTGWKSVWGVAPAGLRAVAARCLGHEDCDLAGREAGWLLTELARIES